MAAAKPIQTPKIINTVRRSLGLRTGVVSVIQAASGFRRESRISASRDILRPGARADQCWRDQGAYRTFDGIFRGDGTFGALRGEFSTDRIAKYQRTALLVRHDAEI